MTFMKVPVNCPICGDPLLNYFGSDPYGAAFIQKSCDKRLSHKLFIVVVEEQVHSINVPLPYKLGWQATWLLKSQELWIVHPEDNGSPVILPYFEPDLTDFPKLLQKIQTYMVFS